MANYKVSDSILQHLYAHHYEASIESISSSLKIDRASVVDNVESLAKEGAVKREGTTAVKLTRHGLYYLESKAFVTRAQILANELSQFAVLKHASDPADITQSTRENDPADVTSSTAKANARMLASCGMLSDNGDDTYTITDDGAKQLAYLRSRFAPASLEPTPAAVRATTRRVAAVPRVTKAAAAKAAKAAAQEPVTADA